MDAIDVSNDDAQPAPLLPRLLRKLGLDIGTRRDAPDAELLEAIPEAVALCELVYDHDVAVDFTYRQCNAAFARHAGRAPKQLISQPSSDVSLRLHVSLLASAAKVAASGKGIVVEFSQPDSGQWYEATMHRHRPGTFVLVLRDITVRKVAQPPASIPQRRIHPGAVRASHQQPVDDERGFGASATELDGVDAHVWDAGAHAQGRVVPLRSANDASQSAGDVAAPRHRVDDGAAALLTRLLASEERLNFALEAAQMGIWSRDLQTNRYTGSDGIFRLLDLPVLRGEQSPVLLFEAMHPDDRRIAAKSMVQANREGKVPNAEFRVVHRNGSVHWLEIRGGVVRDPAGKPQQAVGVAIDITERKKLASALARANRAHLTLSAGSVAVMRAQTEPALLQAACSVLVKEGGYKTASIGYARYDAEQSIAVAASAGGDADWLASTKPCWSRAQAARPVEIAIRDGKPQVMHDIAHCDVPEWKDEALARGFRANAALPLMEGDRAFGALSVYADDPAAFDTDELALLGQLADVVSFGVLALRARRERDRGIADQLAQDAMLRSNLEASIQAIASTIEMRDAYTAGHQRRVAALATAIGRRIGLEETALQGLHLGSIVHDVGKIRIPAEILSKPGKLNRPERELLELHTEIGFEILKDVRLPWPIAEMVRQHHERMDGSGYPRGLKGDQILLEARIIAVADVVEAMSSHRPYRAALGIDAAMNELRRTRGIGLDAAVVDACIELFENGQFEFPLPPATSDA